MRTLAECLFWIYTAVCAGLTVLGIYRIVILAAWLRSRPRAVPDPAPAPDAWPHVTVQLPVFNERFVVRRLLRAAARLDYPAGRLQIQILDDSTDRTAVFTRRAARVLRRRGIDVEWIRRAGRAGYKAGALAHGLRTATGEFIAIFDADFVPDPDFLRRMLPSVMRPEVGVVQARWRHLNRDATWFTRLQAILLDGHFTIEQPSRHANRWLLTFNGTAGIWRRTAIEQAGGWTSDTLTEDLDLSLRAQLAGWHIVYRDDVVVPAELPFDSNSFRAQQRRWTKGGVQVARKTLGRVLRAPLPWHVRAEAALHLCSYAGYPLLVLLALLRTPAHLLAPRHAWLGVLPGEWPLLLFATLPLAVFYAIAQRRAGVRAPFRRLLRHAFPAMALGAGLAVSNAIAVVEGLFGRGLVFERTPKRGTLVPAPAGRRRFYAAPGTRLAALELGMLLYLVACKVFAGRTRWGEIPFLAFFVFGLLAMSVPSLRSAWTRNRPSPAEAV